MPNSFAFYRINFFQISPFFFFFFFSFLGGLNLHIMKFGRVGEGVWGKWKNHIKPSSKKDLNQIKWWRSFHCLNTQHRKSSRKSKFVDVVDKRKANHEIFIKILKERKLPTNQLVRKSQAPRTLVAWRITYWNNLSIFAPKIHR